MHFSSCHAPGVKKDLSVAEPLDFLEPTLQRQHLKKTFLISDHTCVSETMQIIWSTKSSQKLNLQIESRHLQCKQKLQKVQNGLTIVNCPTVQSISA